MSHLINRDRLYGFSLFELSAVLAVTGILIAVGYTGFVAYHDKAIASNLANQASTDAANFTRFISNNYNTYYTATQNGSIATIPYSLLINDGYAPVGSNVLTLQEQQAPCAAIMYNSQSQSLQAIMYYTTAANSSSWYTKAVAANTAHDIGAAGGYIDVSQNMVVGTGDSWQLALNSSLFSGINNCDLHSLPSDGIVVNLSMLSDYPQNLAQDYSLHRVPDTSGNLPGTPAHTNTMQTDIIMASSESPASMHGIFFSSNANAASSPYLTAGTNPKLQGTDATGNANDIVLANAGIAADSINPLLNGAMSLFSACASSDQGKIVQQKNPSGIVYSDLQCSYNPLQCATDPNTGQANVAGYCYIPITDISIVYHPNTTSFTCTNSYIDVSIPPVLGYGNVPANVSGCTWGNPINNWSATSSIVAGAYSIPITITATTDWAALNCANPPADQVTAGIIKSVACTTAISVIDYAP